MQLLAITFLIPGVNFSIVQSRTLLSLGSVLPNNSAQCVFVLHEGQHREISDHADEPNTDVYFYGQC